MQGIIHTILGGANIGILVLATGAFFFRLALGRQESDWAKAADRVVLVAAVVGVGLAIFSGLSGIFGTWTREAVRETALTQNKMLVTTALLGSWGLFIFLRLRFGHRLWQELPLQLWSAVLVFIGFVNTVLAGSMGGSASLKGTALDPVFWSLNINRYISLSWSAWASVVVIILSIAAVVYTSSRQPGTQRQN